MPTPPANATVTTLQIGTWNPLSDAWSLNVDLNDHVTWTLHAGGLKLDQPEKASTRTFNVRTAGETVARIQYKNRHVQCSVWLRGATTAAMMASVRALLAAVESPPVCLRVALPGATQYSYADVLAVTHNIPADPQTILAGAITHVELDFECRPAFRGDRVTLQNLAWNPGFEAPSGPGVQVFNDGFATTNAYAVQAGAALGTDTSYYPDTILADAPLRYFRLGEAAQPFYDATGSGVTLSAAGGATTGVAGACAGDNDKAITLNGSNNYALISSTSGLPTSGSISIECWMKFAANPGGTAVVMNLGGAVGGQGFYLELATTGKVLAGNGTANTAPSAAALTTGTYHHLVATFDGTNIRVYADGSLVCGPTAIAVAPVYGSLYVGQYGGANLWFAGQVDEVAVYTTALSATQVTNHYNAGHNSASTASNTALLAGGNRVSFGSPAWAALGPWLLRFRWYQGATSTFYLHRTDANNYLAVVVTQTALTLNHVIGGSTHQLATASMSLGDECCYWLRVTQFPAPASDPPYVAANLATDVGGVRTTVITSIAACTFDAATALVGAPQVDTSGGALALGGNYSNVHTVALFGPGAWTFAGTGGTGPCSGAWDGARAELGQSGNATAGTQTTPNGPVTSFGAARVDLPAAGTVSAQWQLYAGGAPGGSSAMPVAAAGDVVYAQAWAKSSGLGNGATVALKYTEYDASGNSLRSGTLQTLTISGGVQIAWGAPAAPNLAGHWTTGASCAYVDVQMVVADTVATNSANGIVWLDNAQVWDATTTGSTAMPYCELRFPQSPAQLVVSGLLGDMAAPAALALGQYVPASGWPTNYPYTYVVGRRGAVSAAAALVAPAHGYYGTAFTPTGTPVLDATSYGGFYVKATVGTSGWNPRALSPKASDAAGVYHVWTRYRTFDGTPTGVQVRAKVEHLLDPWYTDVNTFKSLGTYFGPYTTPLTAANQWFALDAGQVQLPSFPAGAQQDTSQQYVVPRPEWVGTTGGGAEGDAGWMALVPVDGPTLVGTANNPSNSPGAVASQFFWVYFDGLLTERAGPADGPGWAYSLEATPAPNAAHAGGGGGTLASGPLNVNNNGAPYLTLDPTLTLAGVSGGVNQLVAFGGGLSSVVLNCLAEISYSPLYLYPR